MARMYSRKKGKAGSTKPEVKTQPSWLRHSPKEIELLIVKLAKDGFTASHIGMVLRDSYGVPDVKSILSKKISVVLKEKKLSPQLPDDLMALMKKAVMVKKHAQANKHDKSAKRGLQLTESKIKRLVKHYKNSLVLPVDWKYDSDKTLLFTE
jgi:small subunit ribosomal protein S15